MLLGKKVADPGKGVVDHVCPSPIRLQSRKRWLKLVIQGSCWSSSPPPPPPPPPTVRSLWFRYWKGENHPWSLGCYCCFSKLKGNFPNIVIESEYCNLRPILPQTQNINAASSSLDYEGFLFFVYVIEHLTSKEQEISFHF